MTANIERAKIVRKALDEQDLKSPAWMIEVGEKLAIYLEQDPDNDLTTMLAASKIERETGLKTSLAPMDTLSPAEQDAARKAGYYF